MPTNPLKNGWIKSYADSSAKISWQEDSPDLYPSAINTLTWLFFSFKYKSEVASVLFFQLIFILAQFFCSDLVAKRKSILTRGRKKERKKELAPIKNPVSLNSFHSWQIRCFFRLFQVILDILYPLKALFLLFPFCWSKKKQMRCQSRWRNYAFSPLAGRRSKSKKTSLLKKTIHLFWCVSVHVWISTEKIIIKLYFKILL